MLLGATDGSGGCGEWLHSHLNNLAVAAKDKLASSFSAECVRAEPEKLYATMEDFRRADPTLKRMLVVGGSGAGKSTLLNILGGWKFVQDPRTYEFEWELKRGNPPLFRSEVSDRAVTEKTEFAHLHWFDDPARLFTAIDTQGLDDPDCTDLEKDEVREKIAEMAADLHHKLLAMGHVDLILVLHNDVYSNRLNPAVYEVLNMVDQKFAKASENVWEHVAIAYTKCNTHDLSWRSGLALKKSQQQQAIRQKVAGCDVNVPIFALGGPTLRAESRDTADASRDGSRSRSRSPRRGAATGPTDFDLLWDLLGNAGSLDTSKLQPFAGVDVRWQSIIDAKNIAEARAKAATIYMSVVFRLSVILVALAWRAYLIPQFLSRYLLLNLPGPTDEILYLVLFVYWVGPEDVWYSLQHAYRTWVQPWLQPIYEQMTASKHD